MPSIDGPRSSNVFDRFYAVLTAPLRLFERVPRRWQDRLVGLVLAGPGVAVLGVAASLSPDPSGMGTHRQLGLGGCAVLTLTGFPCPMCGMTTTFTHLAHFQIIDGALNQPFGLLLFAATVVATAIGLSDLISPSGRWRTALRWVERHETGLAITLLVGMFAGWTYKTAMVLGYFSASP